MTTSGVWRKCPQCGRGYDATREAGVCPHYAPSATPDQLAALAAAEIVLADAGRDYHNVAGAIRQLLTEIVMWQDKALTAYTEGALAARLIQAREEEALQQARIRRTDA